MDSIAELSDYQKNICLEFILIKYLEANKTKDNDKIDVWLVGDESGTIEFGVWNCSLNPGDVIHLSGGYTSLFQGKKRLFVSKAGWVSRVRTFRKTFKASECHREMLEDLLR
ncbi:hypothetical protein [Encephalitozoon cuniculi GB-M1]|uniref:Uncharacterized protein n=2 Tax=Encephalitozoon cuniculi TaxID=6035 RepID=Q8SWK9_ENCCU|nr:uncharacterized protein ECU01_0880 [Encephalitozoon cuniculi GB-M1]KMV66741.1 hypothetical protein M970_010710 [Encephalitozoon cuniculi EcunIII-L]CAD24958.2 hypothetical protein [Encephalitozoon cuniculi GB-M1]